MKGGHRRYSKSPVSGPASSPSLPRSLQLGGGLGLHKCPLYVTSARRGLGQVAVRALRLGVATRTQKEGEAGESGALKERVGAPQSYWGSVLGGHLRVPQMAFRRGLSSCPTLCCKGLTPPTQSLQCLQAGRARSGREGAGRAPHSLPPAGQWRMEASPLTPSLSSRGISSWEDRLSQEPCGQS